MTNRKINTLWLRFNIFLTWMDKSTYIHCLGKKAKRKFDIITMYHRQSVSIIYFCCLYFDEASQIYLTATPLLQLSSIQFQANHSRIYSQTRMVINSTQILLTDFSETVKCACAEVRRISAYFACIRLREVTLQTPKNLLI